MSGRRGSPVPQPEGCSLVLGGDARGMQPVARRGYPGMQPAAVQGCIPLLGGDARPPQPSRDRAGTPLPSRRVPQRRRTGVPSSGPLRARQRSCASAPTFPVFLPPYSGLSCEGCSALCKHL